METEMVMVSVQVNYSYPVVFTQCVLTPVGTVSKCTTDAPLVMVSF
jgi:hypothetical protein